MNKKDVELLRSGANSARIGLTASLKGYASAEHRAAHHPHALGVLFRKLGACRMLVEGTTEPLFIGEMQAVSGYLFQLPQLAEEDKVTSRAGVFWDAIGGEYWEAALQIAAQSRTTYNPAWEREDEFLYVWFLMVRYFLGLATVESKLRQQAILKRWQNICEGDEDQKWALCDALFRGDEMVFGAALTKVAEQREAEIHRQVKKKELPSEDALWSLAFWGEGLALLRLAVRDRLQVSGDYPGIPHVVRVANPFVYDEGAWRQIDFSPRRRGVEYGARTRIYVLRSDVRDERYCSVESLPSPVSVLIPQGRATKTALEPYIFAGIELALKKEGEFSDYLANQYRYLVLRRSCAKEILARFNMGDHEVIPARFISKAQDENDYVIVNPLASVACLERGNQKEVDEFVDYRSGKLYLKEKAIPKDRDVFRVKGIPAEYMFSERLVAFIREQEFTNFIFDEVVLK